MKKTNATAQKDLKTMEKMLADLQLKLVESEKKHQEHIKSKDTLISALHHQLFILKNAQFGRKSEKLGEDKQLDLGFDEAELLAAQDIEPEELIETRTVTIKKKKLGRKPLPKNMPYIEHSHDINDADKHCACGCVLTHIGNETSEQLDVLPQVFTSEKNTPVSHAKRLLQPLSHRNNLFPKALPRQVLWRRSLTPNSTAICLFIVKKICLKAWVLRLVVPILVTG